LSVNNHKKRRGEQDGCGKRGNFEVYGCYNTEQISALRNTDVISKIYYILLKNHVAIYKTNIISKKEEIICKEL